MKSRASPPNLVKLLNDVVGAASRTPSGRPRRTHLHGGVLQRPARTPIPRYRRQLLARVLGDATQLLRAACPYRAESDSWTAAACS